jgi:hypothetical protein
MLDNHSLNQGIIGSVQSALPNGTERNSIMEYVQFRSVGMSSADMFHL